MNVNITLEPRADARVTISTSSEDGMCWIELREGNRDIGAIVNIEELKHALRKLTAK